MCIGTPGRIVSVDADRGEFALAEVGGIRREVSLALLEDGPPSPGDWVLVQLGFAMQRMTEAEATEATRLLRALSDATAEDVLVDWERLADAATTVRNVPR